MMEAKKYIMSICSELACRAPTRSSFVGCTEPPRIGPIPRHRRVWPAFLFSVKKRRLIAEPASLIHAVYARRQSE